LGHPVHTVNNMKDSRQFGSFFSICSRSERHSPREPQLYYILFSNLSICNEPYLSLRSYTHTQITFINQVDN